MTKSISDQLLAYLEEQNEKSGVKGTLTYFQDHWSELFFGSQLEAEMAWHHEQANPTPAQTTQAYHEPKNPYSAAISAKKAARSKQGLNCGANAENTDTRKERLYT